MRYSVCMVDMNPLRGFVEHKLLVAKFVAKGDAIAYAIWRRDNDRLGYHWHVETPGSVRGGNVFKAEPLAARQM